MKHADLLEGLASTVRRHEALFQSAREHELLLAPHTTGIALFDALKLGSGLPWEARGWLLRVVVREYQRARHPLRYALAARGLDPMVGRLRARLRGPDAERDSALHIALAEELGRLRVERSDGLAFPLLTLRRAVERKLFPVPADCERDRDEEAAFMHHAGMVTPEPHEDPPPFIECLAHELAELLVERSGDDSVVRVLAGVETLDDQVERRSSEHLTKECLQKRHHRALVRVRGELSGRVPGAKRDTNAMTVATAKENA